MTLWGSGFWESGILGKWGFVKVGFWESGVLGKWGFGESEVWVCPNRGILPPHIHSSYTTFQTLLENKSSSHMRFSKLKQISTTCKLFRLKKVAEKTYSLKHFCCLERNPLMWTLNGSFLTHQAPKIPGARNFDPLFTISIFSLKYLQVIQ